MRYGEEETSAILRRAAEMQSRRLGESAEAGNGLSLAEIERAAADIGIRPEFIRAAVAEQEGRRVHFVPSGVFELRRALQGPITEALWREMVDALQQSYGKVGVSSRSGDTFEWQLKNDPDPHTRPWVHVIVHSRDGGSEIILRSAEGQGVRRGWILGGLISTFVSLMFSMPFVAATRMDILPGLLTMAFFAAPFFAATGFGIRTWRRKDRNKHARLMDLLGYVAKGATVTEATYSSLPASEVEPQTLTLGRSR